MSDGKGGVEPFIRRMRIPAYLVFGLATPLPVLEVLANLWPFHFGLANWRFGALGTLSTMLAPSMIGLLLLIIVAGLSGDRMVMWVLSAISWLFAVLGLVISIFFVLDMLQTRAVMKPDVLHRFDFASALALARILFVTLSAALMGFQTWRHLRGVPQTSARRPVAAGAPSMLVGRGSSGRASAE
jgi:hypothetical protein